MDTLVLLILAQLKSRSLLIKHRLKLKVGVEERCNKS